MPYLKRQLVGSYESDASVRSVDCDEFAMASTHESGGFPHSVNLVT